MKEYDDDDTYLGISPDGFKAAAQDAVGGGTAAGSAAHAGSVSGRAAGSRGAANRPRDSTGGT